MYVWMHYSFSHFVSNKELPSCYNSRIVIKRVSLIYCKWLLVVWEKVFSHKDLCQWGFFPGTSFDNISNALDQWFPVIYFIGWISFISVFVFLYCYLCPIPLKSDWSQGQSFVQNIIFFSLRYILMYQWSQSPDLLIVFPLNSHWIITLWPREP